MSTTDTNAPSNNTPPTSGSAGADTRAQELIQGQTFTDINGNTGVAKYDPNNGSLLAPNQIVKTPVPPAISAPTTINSTNINSGAPVALPQAVTPTATPALQGAVTTTLGAKTQAADDAAKSQVQNDAGGIVDLINQIGDVNGAGKEAIYAANGVDQAKKASDDAAQQIQAEQAALNSSVTAIQNENPTGQLTGSQRDQIALLQQKSAQKQADYALIQSAADRKYSDVAAIADRQLQAKLEPLQTALQARQFLYTNNKDLFDKADAANLAQEQRDYNELQQNLTDVKNIKVQAATNGAPISVINALSGATTVDQALAAAKGYLSDPLDRALKQAQLQKALIDVKTAGQAASQDSVGTLAQSLVNGTLAPSELSKRATGAAAYQNVLTQANAISMQQTGKPFDISKADRDYKFANNATTQQTLQSFGTLVGTDGAPGNLDQLVNLSNGIDRTKFPALNNTEAWAKLSTGDPAIAEYYATLTEVSDNVAKVLQGGTGGTSDAKLAQATALFNKGFSKDQITAVSNSLKTLLTSRASNIVGNNPYLSDYADSFGLTQKTGANTIIKGNLSSSDYVNKVLTSQGVKYTDVVSQIPSGQIGVIDNSTGQIGSVPESEFDSSKYTRI